jgi:two-component system OmpR family sensor kinase
MDHRSQQNQLVRFGSAGLIGGLGVVFFGLNLRHVIQDPVGAPELVLAALGTLLGLVLLGVGAYLYAADFSATQLARIAGWAALGTVLLGLVLILIELTGVPIGASAAATLLSVSTFAHVLIGVRDVQRIRATELARKREKLSVLNRLVRHNLRHEAQKLLGVQAAVKRHVEDPADTDLEDIGQVATRLTEMHDQLERSQSLLRGRASGEQEVDIAAIIESVVEPFQEQHPDLSFVIDIPDSSPIRAGTEVEAALEELVENATTHAEHTVQVTLSENGGTVTISVEDDGPGIPDAERAVIMREAEIGDLSHSQGLGLWFVRWVMDTYDGSIDIEADETGTHVELAFPA